MPTLPDEITCKDVEQLPLIHGSYSLSENLESIRKIGLIPKHSRNITPIDRCVRKQDCVFLRVARTFTNGDGELLMVDPSILENGDIQYYPLDLEAICNEILHYIQNQRNILSAQIKNRELLLRIMDNTRKQLALPESMVDIKKANKLYDTMVESSAFSEYLRSYLITKNEMYRLLALKWKNNGCNASDFFFRHPFSQEWEVNEEICVPKKIEPRHILGFWNRQKYFDFGIPVSPRKKEINDFFVKHLYSKMTAT
jgi:hypothetical protein